MTISNSVKAQFFALYLNQPVWLRHSYKKEHLPINLNPKILWNYEEADGYLQLRSVSDLTDEESLNVYSIFHLKNGKQDHSDLDDILRIGKSLSRSTWTLCSPLDTLIMHSYLRSIGIALPFTYLDESHHPITLSVEELVNLNWVKMPNKKAS